MKFTDDKRPLMSFFTYSRNIHFAVLLDEENFFIGCVTEDHIFRSPLGDVKLKNLG